MLRPDLITELQDMTALSWARTRESSGTAGSYLKSYRDRDGSRLYYKLSCYDPARGITGHESVNELVADRLLTVLGIEHLSYQLIHARVVIEGEEYTTWVCASESFRRPGESKLALDDYYELHREPGEKPMDFCVRCGWEQYIYDMLITDFLILNRDRHGANIEVLQEPGTDRARLAPLFDHGLSLVFQCADPKELSDFDVMKDLPVQCFVGTRSARANLSLVPKEAFAALRPLEERDRAVIFRGLDAVLDPAYLDTMWEMISRRWKYCEDLFHTK